VPPSILLSLIIATLYGCAFHAVMGRRLWQWPLYWISSLGGFFAGYVLGIVTGFEMMRIGSVPVVAASLGAFIALLLSWYFSGPWAIPPDAQRGASSADRTRVRER
jgi:predicted membrane-bound dolichyl-phosphate-mannose-protein mannosyltransferase